MYVFIEETDDISNQSKNGWYRFKHRSFPTTITCTICVQPRVWL